MAKEKKRWRRPKLIILERGKPEEAVLASCKTGASEGPNSPKCKDNAPLCSKNASS